MILILSLVTYQYQDERLTWVSAKTSLHNLEKIFRTFLSQNYFKMKSLILKTITHVNLKILTINKFFWYNSNQLLTKKLKMFKIFKIKNQKVIHLRYQSLLDTDHKWLIYVETHWKRIKSIITKKSLEIYLQT